MTPLFSHSFAYFITFFYYLLYLSLGDREGDIGDSRYRGNIVYFIVRGLPRRAGKGDWIWGIPSPTEGAKPLWSKPTADDHGHDDARKPNTGNNN